MTHYLYPKWVVILQKLTAIAGWALLGALTFGVTAYFFVLFASAGPDADGLTQEFDRMAAFWVAQYIALAGLICGGFVGTARSLNLRAKPPKTVRHEVTAIRSPISRGVQ
jgi:hypothetical protein